MNKTSFKPTHGLWSSCQSTYRTWQDMHQRCTNPKNHNFANYGGRGISVCSRWDSFGLFVEDMGKRPPKHTIDRVNNDGNYEPSNCRWATAKQQRDNQRSCYRVTFNGRTDNITNWARSIGIHPDTLKHRIVAGWPLSLALTTGKTNGRFGQNLSAARKQGGAA